MNVIKALSVTVIVLLTTIGVCNAEPSPTVKYLMNTPVSVFDFGMYELRRYLEGQFDIFNPKSNVDAIVALWDKDRIVIKVMSGISYKNEKLARRACRKTLKEVRTTLDIDPTTGRPSRSFVLLNQDADGVMDSFFYHRGYDIKSDPQNLKRALDKLTEISVHTSYLKGDKTMRLKAKGSLLGTDIVFSEKEQGPE